MLRSLVLAIGLALLSGLGISAASADVLVNQYVIDTPAEGGVMVVTPGVGTYAVVPVPIRPADCGVYRYWDGARCVDARYSPPSLDRE